jgi:hypothetical protein
MYEFPGPTYKGVSRREDWVVWNTLVRREDHQIIHVCLTEVAIWIGNACLGKTLKLEWRVPLSGLRFGNGHGLSTTVVGTSGRTQV